MAPFDALRRRAIGVLRVLGRPTEGHGGDIGRHHVPSMLGEPDRVGPLAAPNVEGPAAHETRDLGHQLRIRLATPDASRLPIALVPEVLVK